MNAKFPILLLLPLLVAPCIAHGMSLAQAELALRDNNAGIQAARIELRGTQGDAVEASRRPPAELSVGSSKISKQHGIGAGRWSDKRVDSTLGLGWSWERGGKRHLRMEGARERGDAAELDVADQLREQRLALHESYFGVKAAQQMLLVAESNRDESARALSAAERQLATGAIATIERNRLAVEDMKVQADARQARQDLLEAQTALGMLIGDTRAPEQLSADDPWPQLAAEAVAASGFDPSRRVDLQAAAARVRAADADRRLARSQRYRDVQLGLEMEREPTDIGGVTWGFSVSVPLTGPDHHRGQIQRAEADYDLALLELQQAERSARAELRQAASQLEASAVRLRQYESQIIPAARQALDGMELAYRRGAANLTDLLDARRTWRESEQERVQALLDHAVALARWQALLELPSSQGIRS